MSAALHMSETLQMWLQMSANPAANIRGPANVVNFANIRDKKAAASACGGPEAVPPGWRISDMKKGREISRPFYLFTWVILSFVPRINKLPRLQRHFIVLIKWHNYNAYTVGPGRDHRFGIVYDRVKILTEVVL